MWTLFLSLAAFAAEPWLEVVYPDQSVKKFALSTKPVTISFDKGSPWTCTARRDFEIPYKRAATPGVTMLATTVACTREKDQFLSTHYCFRHRNGALYAKDSLTGMDFTNDGKPYRFRLLCAR